MKRHQALLPEAALPDSAARREQFEEAAECLERAGYVRIGLDHFARPDDEIAVMAASGQLRRNFQGYTTDRGDALIGIGASAISSFSGGFSQNHASVPDYRDALARKQLATVRGVRTTPADRLRADIIEKLMCAFSVDVGEVCLAHRVEASALAPDMDRLAPLVAAGFAVREGGVVRVDPAQRHLVRVVSAAFDARSDTTLQRYSMAV
jgi:oxygen-independent coproporphyrinogen-3 oxidase